MTLLSGVWATAPLTVVVGDNQPTVPTATVLENVGSGWAPGITTDIGFSRDYFSVWGQNDDVFACGQTGSVIRRVAGSWTPVGALGAIDLHGIAGAASDNVFVVGASGSIFHYTGR
jgi:hypothetical protein